MLGITVEADSIHFKGFYFQGSGSSFAADVDLVKLIEGIRKRVWVELMPESELDIETINVPFPLFPLIKKETIDLSAQIKAHSSHTSIVAYIDWRYDSERNFSNIDNTFATLKNWLYKVAETLNNYLYRSLQEEYEFLTGEARVAQTLKEYEYFFTIDGEPAFHLEALADEK